jgi:hypothetical protein
VILDIEHIRREFADSADIAELFELFASVCIPLSPDIPLCSDPAL